MSTLRKFTTAAAVAATTLSSALPANAQQSAPPCSFAIPFEARIVPKTGRLGERFTYNLAPIIVGAFSMQAAAVRAQPYADETRSNIGIACAVGRGQFVYGTVGPKW